MAAAHEVQAPQVIDLRQLSVEQLNPLLEEESRAWRHALHWDFEPSAELVRRFVRIQALSGQALLHNGRCVGYSYFVCEERKGLIGDLYVHRDFATVENEDLLLSAVLRSLVDHSYVRRVESQLMMLRAAPMRVLPYAKQLTSYQRKFMTAPLEAAKDLPAGRAANQILLENWSERRQDEAAHLIADAYCGHVDSQINDQYRTVAGARRFLLNIVQYPGCGSFYQPASHVAVHPVTQRVVGIALASVVAGEVGHITQVCVAPSVQGQGIGYQLMRQSMNALASNGFREASLTVTASNREAIQLYERLGFVARREFSAYVWERF